MLSRLRKAMDEKEQGFTLIELLVVIIIIGILAAIAIPVFLNQRQKATESSMKSDLRTVANQLETYFVDHQNYVAVASGTGSVQVGTGTDITTVQLSSDNTISGTISADAATYCLAASNPKVNDGTAKWFYDSDGGGLTETNCGAAAGGDGGDGDGSGD